MPSLPVPDSLDKRLRVLFVPQWYPCNQGDNPASGTFCREHVKAAALYDEVAVLSFSARKERKPTLRLDYWVDDEIPTFVATYGHSPIPKSTLPFFLLHLRRAIGHVIRKWGYPDLIHTQDMRAFYVMKAAQRFQIPFIISQHSSALRRRDLTPRTVRQLRWSFAQAATVLHVNPWAPLDYRYYKFHSNFCWLPNALDTGLFHPPYAMQREPFLLHVSGFTPEKRFSDVVRAFARVRQARPNARLEIVGDTCYRSTAQALAAKQLSPGSYHFHGFLNKEKVAELMRRASGLVLVSEFETFGCVLIESMACACPVLTTQVGGIPAVVRQSEGLFVKVGDIEAISNGMISLLDNNHSLDMGRISHETRRRFSYATIGRLLHREHLTAAA